MQSTLPNCIAYCCSWSCQNWWYRHWPWILWRVESIFLVAKTLKTYKWRGILICEWYCSYLFIQIRKFFLLEKCLEAFWYWVSTLYWSKLWKWHNGWRMIEWKCITKHDFRNFFSVRNTANFTVVKEKTSCISLS